MNKNKKTLIKVSVAFGLLPFLILPSLLFINSKPKSLNLIRPHGFDVYDNQNNDKEAKTRKLLDILIETVFSDDKIRQQEFIKKQEENKNQLLLQVKDLSIKYLKSKSDNDLKNLKDFYSENCLFMLQKLNKFELHFLEYWKLESKKGKELHSNSFLESIKKKEKPKNNYVFLDSYLEKIHPGSENEDLKSLSIVYLKKDR
ncbi:aromatic motif membrane protein [Mycoplasma capricolum]|uniref:aromatic motif membrane protein n=1 Tax=Mycoplasma capricolum TaxID=2095 RepID=UPI0004EF9305|nr:aromatic motif membrane protein [Mycoplasma capricolum]CEA12275.1 hypothetical protein MCCPF38_00937 [Mycoplasma capricolum subsp. capripneumoniae]